MTCKRLVISHLPVYQRSGTVAGFVMCTVGILALPAVPRAGLYRGCCYFTGFWAFPTGFGFLPCCRCAAVRWPTFCLLFSRDLRGRSCFIAGPISIAASALPGAFPSPSRVYRSDIPLRRGSLGFRAYTRRGTVLCALRLALRVPAATFTTFWTCHGLPAFRLQLPC